MGKIIGIDRRHYPAQASVIHDRLSMAPMDYSENPPPTVVVLVAGDVGDYAAYCGHGTEQWVAAHGDKLSFAMAAAHFPNQLKEELYRA